MPDNTAILKRLKDAEAQLDAAHEAAEKTTEVIKKSQQAVARAQKDVQVLDTSKTAQRKRRANKKR